MTMTHEPCVIWYFFQNSGNDGRKRRRSKVSFLSLLGSYVLRIQGEKSYNKGGLEGTNWEDTISLTPRLNRISSGVVEGKGGR